MPPTTDPPPDDAQRLLLDIRRLAAALDAVSTRDDLATIQRLLDHGIQEYHHLHGRAVETSGTDAAAIDAMMEKVRARLKFLERLKRQK
jgi:diadenosine tetraphosphate (Ap4A) HIT family hydrolase